MSISKNIYGIQLNYLIIKNGHCPILHIKHHMSILSIVSKTGGKKTKNICNVSSIIHNQGNCGP
jgi:hypothetical protein